MYVPKSKLKTSYNIALCRRNDTTNEVEILMIKKRFTYQFFSFINGNYSINNEKYINHLFSRMSHREKVMILNMNYDTLWNEIWITKLRGDKNKNMISKINYRANKEKFNSFKSGKLKELIKNTSSYGTPWDIPGGRRRLKETELDAAIREFWEEVGLSQKQYNVKINLKPIFNSHIDSGVKYRNVYFIAEMNKDEKWDPSVSFKNVEQIIEVEMIKWIKYSEISFCCMSNRDSARLKHLFKKISSKYKKVSR